MHKKLENADLNTIKTIVQEVKTKKNYTCIVTKKKNENDPIKFFENFVENATRMAKIVVNEIHPNPKELVANILEKIVCGTMDVAARINKCYNGYTKTKKESTCKTTYM